MRPRKLENWTVEEYAHACDVAAKVAIDYRKGKHTNDNLEKAMIRLRDILLNSRRSESRQGTVIIFPR